MVNGHDDACVSVGQRRTYRIPPSKHLGAPDLALSGLLSEKGVTPGARELCHDVASARLHT